MKRLVLLLVLILALAVTPASAVSVQNILGVAGNGPVVLGPGTISTLCAVPGNCTDLWDVRTIEGEGIFYGDEAFGGSSNAECRKTVDFGVTWNPCPTAYPMTTVPREMDIPSDGSLISLRFEGIAANICRLDKSTDGGNSWATITIATGGGGANLQCNPTDGTGRFFAEQLRCIELVCVVLVQDATSQYIYRSNNSGDTWSLVHTQARVNGWSGLFFDGTYAFASTYDLVFGQAFSIDGGQTWTPQTSASVVDRNCGIAEVGTIFGFAEPMFFGCYNGAFAELRISNYPFSTTVAPIIPSASFSTFSAPRFVSRGSGRLYVFILTTTGKVWFSNNDATQFGDVTDSFAPSTFRLTMYRNVNGDAYFSYSTGGLGVFGRISG